MVSAYDYLYLSIFDLLNHCICSYHQKYLLRQCPNVLASLSLSNEELKNSYIATRLNGYLGGYSNLQKFDAEAEKLGLSEEQVEAVRKLVAYRSN